MARVGDYLLLDGLWVALDKGKPGPVVCWPGGLGLERQAEAWCGLGEHPD